MAQKKLLRFAQIKTFPNVLEYPTGMKGEWNHFLKNENPIVLELACGRGEYTIGLARLYPNQNFIGIDVKGNRMYIGAKKALEETLTNVAFIRTQVEKLPDYFAPEEVSEIWITFPDPQPRWSKAKKRLTHPRFLRLYKQVLKTGGTIHLKTDSPQLYDFTNTVIELFKIHVIKNLDDAYAENLVEEPLKIKTHYERLDIAESKKIHYLQFQLPDELPDLDELLKEMISK
ncbi:MAG: tRNA (guanosine(46)-N7)-methyltransferase TrmB [Ferruginibacter sp.]